MTDAPIHRSADPAGISEPSGDQIAGWYRSSFLAQVTRALTLVDRDPTSPTYGCFDRNYWHYRTQDFPSGIVQESCLLLAQAFVLGWPENAWRGRPRLRELALAGIDFMRRSAHRDGSCDDYFPYERALGATAFAAAAGAQALRLLSVRDEPYVGFLKRRVGWLLAHQESGRLSNHQALVALAAARLGTLLGDDGLLMQAKARMRLCLDWQHDEGWFAEYEGADPGYQSFTLAFLAALREHLPCEELDRALERGTRFAAHFAHPDGSYGGVYGSRNTDWVLPSGFEAQAAWGQPEARFLADMWGRGATRGFRSASDDDRMYFHQGVDLPHAADHRQQRILNVTEAPHRWPWPDGRRSFDAAHLHVIRSGRLHLVLATNKGGAFRAFRITDTGGEPLCTDAGPVLVLEDGRRVVTHRIDADPEVTWSGSSVSIRGRACFAAKKLMTPAKLVVFRMLNGTIGRISPNLLRSMLQKMLITGKPHGPIRFERTIDWSGGDLLVVDQIKLDGSIRLSQWYSSTDANTIYVAASNFWQEGACEAWTTHDDAVRGVRETGRSEVRRVWPYETPGSSNHQ